MNFIPEQYTMYKDTKIYDPETNNYIYTSYMVK